MPLPATDTENPLPAQPTFNSGPIPSSAKKDDPFSHLWYFEATLSLPKTDRARDSLRAHHSKDRRARINALKRIKCIFSDDVRYTGFWFAVNTDGRFARIPEHHPASASALPVDITLPQWLDDQRPDLGFTPSFGGNEGADLSLIRIPDAAIPTLTTELKNGSYGVGVIFGRLWRQTEDALTELANILSAHLVHLPALHRPAAPKTFRYESEFPSHQQAIEAVTQARDAFSNLTTHISFLLSMWRFSELRYPFSNLHSWIRKTDPVYACFAEELTWSSNVGDFRLGTRAGYLVNLFQSPSQWIPYMHIWAEAGVPLWIYAGTDPRSSLEAVESQVLASAIDDWIPFSKHIRKAYGDYETQLARGVYINHPYRFACYGTYLAKLAEVIPPSELYTELGSEAGGAIFHHLAHFGFRDGDYVPGMHPREYFAIRNEAVLRWRLTQSGRHAPRPPDVETWSDSMFQSDVFVWEHERGQWMRRKVNASLRDIFFLTFPPCHRWWDALRRDVELCSWLDPSLPGPELCVFQRSTLAPAIPPPLRPAPHPPASPERDYDSEDEDEWGVVTPAPAPAALSLRTEHYLPPSSACVKFDAQHLPSLQTILTDRLGYRSTIPLPAFHTMEATRNLLPRTAPERAITALGVPLSALADVVEPERSTLVDAVNTLLLVGSPVGELRYLYGRSQLPSRWDISLLNPLSDRPSLPPTLAAYGFSITDTWGTIIHRCVVGRSEESLEKQWWVLVVDATTLVQICRAKIGEIRPIARYLIQHGITFHIAIMKHLEKPPVDRRVARQGSGSYTDDAPLTAKDYSGYEERLKAFFATRRGALALRCGGVIWRLAIESVNPRMIKDTLDAPTRSAVAHGSVCGSALGFDLVANQLEPHELDLILGAYRYRSRNKAVAGQWNPEVTTTLWPPHAAWAKSSLNTGEWNLECERWFQDRQKALRRGEAAPKSSKAWRNELRKQPETRRLWKNYESLVVDAYLTPTLPA